MNWKLLLLIAALASLQVCAGGIEPALPQQPDPFLNNARQNEATIQSYPEAAEPILPSQLPRLVEENGQLIIKPGDVESASYKRIRVEGSPLLLAFRSVARENGPLALVACNLDAIESDGYYMVRCSGNGTSVTVSAYGGRNSGVYLCSLNRAGTSFSVTVADMVENGARGKGRTVFNSQDGDELNVMRQAQPADYDRYVQPLLDMLALDGLRRSKPGDAYRAFPELMPQPGTREQLIRTIPLLASPDERKRQEGQRQLEAMGQPGLLAAMRMDRSLLVPEESARLDAYVAQFCTRRADQAALLRKNPAFLIECLEHEDREVRRVGLLELRMLLRRDIQIDIDAGEADRKVAAAALRKMLGLGGK